MQTSTHQFYGSLIRIKSLSLQMNTNHILAVCPHPLCRHETHFPESKILIPYRLCEVNGSHMLATGECILKTGSSVHKKPLTKEDSYLQAHWRIYRYLDLSVPCPVRAQGWFSFPQRIVPGDPKCREISLMLFLFAEFQITAILYSLFSGSLIKSSLKWTDHFFELHGLGNQAVDLPEKFPRNEAVKKLFEWCHQTCLAHRKGQGILGGSCSFTEKHKRQGKDTF